MSAFSKVNSFVENLAEGVIDLSSSLSIALTNTAHTATWDELADLTQISYANMSTGTITVTSSALIGGTGTYKLVLQDLTLTASGGTVGPFQYVYVYDGKSSGNKLIAYKDYGSSITLQSGETLALDFDATNGFLQLE